VLEPHFDRIRILSSTSAPGLRAQLPQKMLRRETHNFKITTYKGKGPGLNSCISLVGVKGLAILAANRRALGRHYVTQAEIACDVQVTHEDARRQLLALQSILAKPRHQRRQVLSLNEALR
jgi:hypothetical protein